MRSGQLMVLILLSTPLLSLPAAATPLVAQASPAAITPQSALERILTSNTLQADWFDPKVLEKAPIAQIQEFIASVKTRMGTYKSVQVRGSDFVAVFERGSVPTKIALDGAGKITKLNFELPTETSR